MLLTNTNRHGGRGVSSYSAETGARPRAVAYELAGNTLQRTAFLQFSGAGSDSADWRALSVCLSASYACVCVDKPGYFGTSAVEAYSLDTIARDAFAACSHLGVRRFVVIGHSLGLLAAIRFVRLYADRLPVAALVSLDGVTLNPAAVAIVEHMGRNAGLLGTLRRRLMRSGMLNLGPGENDYPAPYVRLVGQSALRDTLAERRQRAHQRAVAQELLAVPEVVRGFVLDEVGWLPPVHVIRAQQNAAAIEQQPEALAFPELAELLRRDTVESEAWSRELAARTGGTFEAVASEHFVQWHRPAWLARRLRLLADAVSASPLPGSALSHRESSASESSPSERSVRARSAGAR